MMKNQYLYNSRGEWIAFRRDDYIFDIDGKWIGWVPDKDNDVVDVEGKYLGTIVGDRFYKFLDRDVTEYPGYPGHPEEEEYPGYPGFAGPAELPPLAEDVDFWELRK